MSLSFYGDQMLVFGHRGASGYAPMNTIPAFELALAQKADGVELDVHLSADGELVVIHDFTVDHTTDSTGPVDSMTLAQLKELDAGAWFDVQYAGTRIPTLDEVFEAISGRMAVNVEIKPMTDGIEQKTADCIRRHGMVEKVIVSSFNPLVLHRFRKAAPEIAVGFLYAPETPPEWMQSMIGFDLQARHPYYAMIDRIYMDQAKRFGYRVNTWTVNDPTQALALRDLDVDCVITDYPDRIRQALGYETA